MTLRILALFFTSLIVLSGCGIVRFVSQDSHSVEVQDSIETLPIEEVTAEFFDREDVGEILDEMPSLEMRAIHSFETNTLRLGSLGTALTDRYIASLTGQYALQRFYEQLNEPIASNHSQWVERVVESMKVGRDGSYSRPYRTITKGDALTFIKRNGEEPLGTVWEQHQDYSMLVRVVVKNKLGRVSSVYFELVSYEPITRLFNEPAKVKPIDVLKRFITEHNDDSAKIAYGRTLLSFAVLTRDRNRQRAQGIAFLRSALSNSNILSHYYYAKALVAQAQVTKNENLKSKSFNDARTHFRVAIDAGFDYAMNDLGRLYLSDVYGTNAHEEGLKLLERARILGNHDANFLLATFYRLGFIVEEDDSKSQQLFVEALTTGNDAQRRDVIEYLSRYTDVDPISQDLYEQIQEMAENRLVLAMTMLGRIHALGLYQAPNLRKAKTWYRRAVRVNPTDADTVNEVAWVLATSNIPGLRQPRYAVRIMNDMMWSDDDARIKAPFIDTWAAAYAANGNFHRAVELQREAIQNAKKDTVEARLLEILEAHLNSFQQQQALDEEVP